MKGKGRLQVYTGNGKGKTTAALGLAVRAACSGMRVYIGQFMKGQDYSEMCLPDRFPEITMEQYGTPEFILPGEKPSAGDIQLAENGLNAIRTAMLSGEYTMVIADEICVTAYMGLVSQEQVLELAASRPGNVEVVFTGRYAGDAVIKVADLVTEMMEIKHYFNTEKLWARTGIEN